MPTVHEILKQSGLDDAAIAALDAKAISGFNTVLTTVEQERKAALDAALKAEAERKAAGESITKAEAERKAAQAALEKAELERRSNAEFYDTQIAPAIVNWDTQRAAMENEKAKAMAEAAFYRTMAEGAKAAGFVPAEAPMFQYNPANPGQNPQNPNQPRDNQGRYIAGAPGSTPGSPAFVDPNQIAGRIGDIAGTISDIQWKHQTLFGKPLPIAPSELIRQADAQKLNPLDWASRTFNYPQREQEIAAEAKRAEEERIRAEAIAPYEERIKNAEKAAQEMVAKKEREILEKLGNNPDVRLPQPSKFADVSRAVKAGERPDPLSLNEHQRRQVTKQAIHSELAESVA